MNGDARRTLVLVALVGFLSITLALPVAHALTQSQQVAVITAPGVINGGTFPATSSGSFAAFTFHNVSVATLNLAALRPGGICGAAGCDTVLLNVASSGIYCNMTTYLPADKKAALVEFVRTGGKLIIYDSECSAQNYSWLPYPFTTNNPGAMGAHGQLNIVENNALSSTNLSDPVFGSKYIDDYLLENNTDAVGDMNVMTTRDANWCLDMSGTNVNHVSGPVHTYARYGSGLIIYNGLDLDYLASTTPPVYTTGVGNIAKVWLQELQVPFNPTPVSALPCGITVVGINIAPITATNILPADRNHTVTATLKDLTNVPQPGILVAFTVISGPNAVVSRTCAANAGCLTDANGQVSFTYTGNGTVGKDLIKACFTDPQQQQVCSQDASKDWVMPANCDIDGDGDIDRNDINAIFAARGQTVPPGNPILDTDGDGLITVNDGRACALRCTRPNCAP